MRTRHGGAGARPRVAWAAAFFLLSAALPTTAQPARAQADTTAVQDTTEIPDFLEALEVEPLVLVEGTEGVRIALEITAWGRRPASVSASAEYPGGAETPGRGTDSIPPLEGAEWGYELVVENPPPFLQGLEWEGGSRGLVPAGETSIESILRFDVGAGGGGGLTELILVVRAEDPAAVPEERRIVIPLEYRARPEAAVSVYPLAWPGIVDFANHTDPEPFAQVMAGTEPMVFDKNWMFFTPAVDTLQDFSWRVTGPDGSQVGSGSFLQGSEENHTQRAGSDAPGAFVAPLNQLAVWMPGREDPGPGPGEYRFEVCEVYDREVGVGGVFGAGEGVPPCLQWREEGTFEIGAHRLHLKDVVLESGSVALDARWENMAIPSGSLRFLDTSLDPNSGSFRFRGDWYAPAAQGFYPDQDIPNWGPLGPVEERLREERPGSDLRETDIDVPEGGTRKVIALRHQVEGTLELRLPEILDPLSDTLGVAEAVLAVQGEGFFSFECFGVTFNNPRDDCRFGDTLTATARLLSPRATVGPPGRHLLTDSASAGAVHGPGEDDRWALGETWGWLEAGGELVEAVSIPSTATSSVPVRWARSNPDRGVDGFEAYRLGALLRREGIVWYVPVEITLGSSTLYAFGVYGPEPGPYDGPLPRVPEELAGDDSELVALGTGGGGPPGDPPADTAVVVPPVVPPVVDPPAVDDPPPDSITGVEPPPTVDPPVEEEDVVDPDTTVGAVQSVAVPSVIGRPAADAVAEIEGLGLTTVVEITEPAASRNAEFIVTRQAPSPGVGLPPGEPVVLGISGRFVEVVVVPDVSGRPSPDAESLLRGMGLAVVVRITGPPTGQGDSERVMGQAPQAGARVAPGAQVTLRALDRWVEPPAPPPVVTPPVVTPPTADPPPGTDTVPDWRRDSMCRSAIGMPVGMMQEGRLQEALDMLRTLRETCGGDMVDPLIQEVEDRLGVTPPVVPPDPPPVFPDPPRDTARVDPPPPVIDQAFHLNDPAILGTLCPRSVTLADGTSIGLTVAEPQPKGIELGYGCVYRWEPRPGPEVVLLWDYHRFQAEPGAYTLCNGPTNGGYLHSSRYEISVHVGENLMNHTSFRRWFLGLAEDAQIAAPCRR